MTCTTCVSRCCKALFLLLLIAILAGIAIGALAFLGILPLIAAVLPYAIAIALVVLLLVTLLVALLLFRRGENCEDRCVRGCICCYAKWVAIAAVIVILTTLGLLVLGGVAIANIFNAVLVGLGAAAFVFMLLGFISLLVCIINCGCRGRDDDAAAA